MKTATVTGSPVFTGILSTMSLVLLGSLLTTLLLQFSSISETSMPYFTYTINGFSLFIGGLLAGRKGGHRGWYYGGLTGIFYFLVIATIGFLAFNVNPQVSSLVYLTISFMIGAVGGIFGVNFSRS
jgi:putative membrane protein (TIGR04086 family)